MEGISRARVGTTFTDRHWRNLLADIEDGQVIPVIGPELLVFRLSQADGQTTLYDHLARELVARFGIEENRLPKPYSFFDVSSLFTQNPTNQVEDLHHETRAILTGGVWPTPEPLEKLAAITHFNLFVSVTFDSLLEQALNEARFGGAGRTRVIAYSEKSQVQDLPTNYEPKAGPTIFHLFGKLNATGDYALTEEKVLEFSHRLQSRDLRPQNLFDLLRNKNLLILGCSFPGWLTRFLLRATKGDQFLTQGARSVVADCTSQSDAGLVMFLERRKANVYAQGDGVAFLDELHQRWVECHPGTQEPPPPVVHFKADSVFISYASEDRPIAEQVKKALDEAGVDVWFDRDKLDAGDVYRSKIEKNIEDCTFFVPLISRHTATEEKRFFRREWNKALDQSKEYPLDYPFIQPILIDDTPIPRDFRDWHCLRLDDLPRLVEDARRRIGERRRAKRFT